MEYASEAARDKALRKGEGVHLHPLGGDFAPPMIFQDIINLLRYVHTDISPYPNCVPPLKIISMVHCRH